MKHLGDEVRYYTPECYTETGTIISILPEGRFAIVTQDNKVIICNEDELPSDEDESALDKENCIGDEIVCGETFIDFLQKAQFK